MGAGAIVTPEAVRLEFEPAGLASRGVARFVDLVVLLVALQGILLVIGGVEGTVGGGAVTIVVTVVVVFLVLFGYPVVAETWFRGRTFGKVAVGLRVVTVEGGPVRFRHGAIRSMFQLLDFVVVPGGAVAILCALGTRRHQRVGDVVAGTFVVRERQGTVDPGAVPFPPPPGELAYVASLDLSALGRDDYRRIRTFLLRAATMPRAGRDALALAIAVPLAERLRHQPPPHVTPDLFLYCLAAAYQQRFGGPVAVAGPKPPPPRPSGILAPGNAPPPPGYPSPPPPPPAPGYPPPPPPSGYG